MTPDRIGFDRLIRLRWLDRAALLAAELREPDALHRAMLAQLADELAGMKAQRNTANVLTRIWWRVPNAHVRLRDEALGQINACTPEERLVFHWGMCLLAYPLFGDIAATMGRLLRLQGVFRGAQVLSRISAEWGNRSTLVTAVPRIIRSLVDWGVLTAAEERGTYRAGTQITVTRQEMASWLLTTAQLTRASDLLASELPHTPEMFVFCISSMAGARASPESR